MSIESFLEHYSPETFKVRVEARDDYKMPTKIQSVARMIALEGRDGIRTLARKYARGTLPPPMYLLEKAATDDKQSLYFNLSALFFGVNLGAIERMLTDGEFSQVEYFSYLDEALVGTPFTNVHEVTQPTQPISRGDLEQMIEVTKRDKTLSSFFDSEISALPKFFQGYVASPGKIPGVFDTTRRLVVPLYRQRALTIVGPQS